MSTRTYYVCDFCGVETKTGIVRMEIPIDKEFDGVEWGTHYHKVDVCCRCLDEFMCQYTRKMSYEQAEKFISEFFPAKEVKK